MSTDSPTNQPAVDTDSPAAPLSGYELVADMMRRQDEVIAELDTLNLRIESAIKQITDTRKREEQQFATEHARDLDAVEKLSVEAAHETKESKIRRAA